MSYRNGSYTAFYVKEPSSEYNLAAYSTPDFTYYQMLRAWKARDASFPFIDSHAKTYDVRDGSDWERTLKPRLRDRLRNSKNIILILSSITRASRALNEEMEYGIGNQGLPVIVVYPEFDPMFDDGCFRPAAMALWERLPTFRRHMDEVPTLHIPMRKEALAEALASPSFMVQTKAKPGRYRL